MKMFGMSFSIWCLDLSLVCFLNLSVLRTAAFSNPCDNEICGSMRVPYPFGISNGCGLNQFKLNCYADLTLMLSINSHEYPVLEINLNGSILINPLGSNCSEAQHAFSIFEQDHTYVISNNNFLILYACRNVGECPSNCSSSSEVPDSPCGNLPPSCCYDLHQAQDHNFTNLGCKLFSSWATDYELINLTELAVQATYGLQLDWAIPGSCDASVCSRNAACFTQTAPAGYTCQCQSGLVGDPYRNGSGCLPGVCGKTATTGCICPDGQLLTATGCLQPPHSNKTRTKLIIAGIILGATIISGILIALAVLRRRHYAAVMLTEARNSGHRRHIEELLITSCNARNITIFAYKDLEKATKGFSQTQMLGHGAHGIVYEGKLHDGSTVAVKRINILSQKGMDHVVNELTVLSSVKHKNLVQLLGCCLDVQDPLLVYEFVPNGTLAEHLQRERGDGLDWITRISIAAEAAQALAYLHSAVSPPIYHRDVKSTNILLDFEYNTKVADFGLSKLILTDESHISTFPQGSPGYLDPEYHQNFILTDRSDVYSFGVVLIEIISGLKVVDFSRNERQVNLAALALTKIADGKLEEIIDPFLEPEKQIRLRNLIQRVAELAFRCLAFDKNARPSMLEVAEELMQIRVASSCAEDQSPFNEQDSCAILPR